LSSVHGAFALLEGIQAYLDAFSNFLSRNPQQSGWEELIAFDNGRAAGFKRRVKVELFEGVEISVRDWLVEKDKHRHMDKMYPVGGAFDENKISDTERLVTIDFGKNVNSLRNQMALIEEWLKRIRSSRDINVDISGVTAWDKINNSVNKGKLDIQNLKINLNRIGQLLVEE